MKETFAGIAAVLAIIGNIPYIFDIIKGRVKPHSYTWFVWTVVSGIVLAGQIAKGAGIGALPTAAAGFFTLIIFLLSLKYGYRKIAKIDTFFLVLALVGIVPWIFTSDATVSVVVAVSIDVIAFIPTFRKTRLEPKTESPIIYSLNIVRHILALISMQAYNVATMLHSIVMIVTNSSMTILIFARKNRK